MNDSMKFIGIALGVMGLGAVIGFTMFPKQISLEDIKKELMILCQDEESCKEDISRYFEQCSQDELTEGMEIKQVFECIHGLKNIEENQVPDIQEDAEIIPQEEGDILENENKEDFPLPIDSIENGNKENTGEIMENIPSENINEKENASKEGDALNEDTEVLEEETNSAVPLNP